MIYTYLKSFKNADRDIRILTYTLVTFFLLLTFIACTSIYKNQYEKLWSLLAPVVMIVSTLSVTRVANRLLDNGNIVRENDSRTELVRTTHHLIAITKDLRQRVSFMKTLMLRDDYPIIALVEISKSIENRYEALYEKDGYKYISGRSVDIITKISSSIYGIGLFSAGIQLATVKNPAMALKSFPYKGDISIISSFDELDIDLKELIDELFNIRNSIDIK